MFYLLFSLGNIGIEVSFVKYENPHSCATHEICFTHMYFGSAAQMVEYRNRSRLSCGRVKCIGREGAFQITVGGPE